MIKRSTMAALALSATALVGIALHEDYRGVAYMPTPDDVPTIGFGSTDGVKMGDTITPPRALARTLADVSKFEAALKKCISVPVHQYEYDAFVSLTYNIGVKAFCNSTLAKKLNAGDYSGACAEIRRWNRQGGKVLPGLTKRREAEYKQCAGIA